jgi:PPM family protein phosphatase
VIRAFGYSDQGRFRPTNEDCFALDEDVELCVVADGLGGHNAGDVAARITVDTILEAVRQADRSAAAGQSDVELLRSAIELASDRVRDAALVDPRCAGMATTVVAARARGDRLFVAHAGDSRAYLLARGNLRQLTQDDSWLAARLAEHPDADGCALPHLPMRHALTNAVGAWLETRVHIVEAQIEEGDVVLLVTDGVHEVMDDWRLEQLLLEDDDPRTIAEKVIRSARNRGSRDNCTALVASVTHSSKSQVVSRKSVTSRKSRASHKSRASRTSDDSRLTRLETCD